MAPTELELQIDYPGAVPSHDQFRCWVGAVLDQAGRGSERLSLVIRVVDHEEGLQLNRDYRQRDNPTNILSFPFEPPPGLPPQEVDHLGDLVICAPVVVAEAAEQGKATEAHWAHLTIHGTLHLLGHDHQQEAEEVTMEAIEQRLLAGIDLPAGASIFALARRDAS